MEEDKPFSYSDFWDERNKREEKKIEKEVFLEKGNPRKGVKGRYLKPKNYIQNKK